MISLPSRLIIHPTGDCNLNCKYCLLYDAGFPYKDIRGLSLSYATIRRLLDDARRLGIRRLFFSGGEPTLHPRFKDILRYALSKNMTYAVATNLTTTDAELLDLLSKAEYLNVGLWASNAFNYGCIQGPEKYFDIVVNNIRYCSSRTRVIIIYTIIPDNVKDIYNTALLAKNLGARSFRARRAYTPYFDALFRQEEIDIMEEEMSRTIRLTDDSFEVNNFLYRLPYGEEKGIEKCLHVLENVVIGCDGEIYPCSYTYYIPEYSLGRIDKLQENLLSDRRRLVYESKCKWKVCTLPVQKGG